MNLTREQKEEIILDYLCYDQVGEYAYGRELNGDSTEIQWIESRRAWQITETRDGEIRIDYESGGCERAVAGLEEEVLDDMILNIYSDEELEDLFEDDVDEDSAE